MSRGTALSAFGLAAACALAVGAACASGSGATASAVSPCTAVNIPVWAPDGTEIAYYGTRWPKPKNHASNNSFLQALCTMNRDGKNSQPIRYTVCSEKCQDAPYQIAWLPTGELVYDIDGGPLYRLTPGQKPKHWATVNSPSFSTDTAGDRVAVGWAFPGCLTCGGPVTVLDFPSGHVVGKAGGTKFQNDYASLSPDGRQVAFQRDGADESGRTFGIWKARADGSGLRRLARKGIQPLWSPTGKKVAYLVPAKNSTLSLRLVPPGGGKGRTLVPRGVLNVEKAYSWSPDGKSIAFVMASGTFGKLAVVDLATGKVRARLAVEGSPTAVWSPDSSELLASTIPAGKKCPWVWRVPARHGKPVLIRRC